MSDPDRPADGDEDNALDPHPFLPSQAFTSDDPEAELEEAAAKLADEDEADEADEEES